ncbi:uncharacterized protein [Rutidosis leptorrhynchoides]|uniref:uncharacterized protein n=1 Tax=Rutidosis leptorrhynchoides TaxID=125765 RepID=UPI003A993231
MSIVTPQIRASADICHRDATCQEKLRLILTQMGLPNGLLPVKDIEEFGYVKETGFLWITQKKPSENKNEKIGNTTHYETEVTANVEKFKVKKITGVKAKKLLMLIPISEVIIDDPSSGKITFKTSSGLNKTYPVSAFVVDDVKKDVASVSVAKDAQGK